MIERRRLTSASYHSPAEECWSRDFFAEQQIAIHARQHDAVHVARHVADRQMSCAPFFVMDVPSVVDSVNNWSEHLPRFQPHYALRCNADPVLARLLADSPGMGFEVANTQELHLALELLPPSNIIYSNPLWTRKAMRLAGDAGVGSIVVGSEKELMDAISYAPDAKILISVSLGCPIRDEALGATSGCCDEDAEGLLMTAFELRANFVGFSFNVDNSDAGVYYKALRGVRHLFEFAFQCGLNPNTIAVGGGFRAPKDQSDKQRFQEVCDSLTGALEQFFPQRQFPLLRLLASPGRFFASSAFTLCTNVIAKRAISMTIDEFGCEPMNTTGYVYQTNDGIYGSFGCRLADCDPQCKPLKDNADDNSSVHVGTVLGPSLDGCDVAQRVFRGRQLAVGEWLLWENMGAYSISMEGDSATAPPVYYFTGKDNWESIMSRRRGSSAASSEASNGESVTSSAFSDCDSRSDGDSVASDEDDRADFITRFDNFFDY